MISPPDKLTAILRGYSAGHYGEEDAIGLIGVEVDALAQVIDPVAMLNALVRAGKLEAGEWVMKTRGSPMRYTVLRWKACDHPAVHAPGACWCCEPAWRLPS